MKKTLSVKEIYIGIGTIFFLLICSYIFLIFILTENQLIRGLTIIYSLLLFLAGLAFPVLLRNKLHVFSDSLCNSISDIINGKNEVTFDTEEETLTGKFHYKLQRLCEITQNERQRLQEEKQSVQEIISDISHQVKTPVTNLKMYQALILEKNLPEMEKNKFCERMGTQIDKLDFLMQSMIKMSRLETEIIALQISLQPVYDTVALALAGTTLAAEKKKIAVTVECDPRLSVPHDKKWTAEALFNIMDNAVKYTPSGGSISVCAEQFEMVTRIDIRDTGRGIPEQHFAQIFKRFYREEAVHNEDGVGIGLFLSREIITRQGGYIQVQSAEGKGSVFSVFLPNERQL